MHKDAKRNTIRLLIDLNKRAFPSSEILVLAENEEIKDNIKDLCLIMGSKLIKKELENEGNLFTFLESKKHFNEVLKAMQCKKTFVLLIHFAWDLLQFYTVVCDPKLQEQTTLAQLNKFLRIKESIFGNCDNNPFILEYKILTMYNEVVKLLEKIEREIVDVDAANIKLDNLLTALAEMQATAKKMHDATPFDSFIIYLNFAIKYTSSQLAEAKFKANEKSYAIGDKETIASQQKLFFIAAQEELIKIKEIRDFTIDTCQSFILGEQYSFGRPILRKLPAISLEDVYKHVSHLADSFPKLT